MTEHRPAPSTDDATDPNLATAPDHTDDTAADGYDCRDSGPALDADDYGATDQSEHARQTSQLGYEALVDAITRSLYPRQAGTLRITAYALGGPPRQVIIVPGLTPDTLIDLAGALTDGPIGTAYRPCPGCELCQPTRPHDA